MERRLTVLRHAKSEWPDGVPDFDRPLAHRGRADAPAAGRWLRDNPPEPGLVLCSPAVRARQTWELAAAELLSAPPVRHDEQLYAATAGALLDVVQSLPDAELHVLFVAHNPGLSDLAAVLSGTPLELKTSGIAVVAWDGAWSDAAPRAARLVATAKPRG